MLSRHPEKSNNQAIYDCVDYDLFRIYQCVLITQSKLIDSEYPKNHFSLKLKGFFRSFGMTYKKAVAFTLAEILITLGVIGVVAAMTLPTVIAKHQEKTTVAKLKKLNSTLQNAFYLVREQDHAGADFETWSGYSDNMFAAEMAKYMKTMKVCEASPYNCFPDVNYVNLTNNPEATYEANTIKDAPSIILENGQILGFRVVPSQGKGQIFTDINGAAPPNRLGVDVFSFIVQGKKLYPRGLEHNNLNSASYCSRGYGYGHNGLGYTAWVVYNENMDYLHCDGLSWNGKHKCSE